VPFELRKTMAQMLGDVIALLAMKHRRAPLPVSSNTFENYVDSRFSREPDGT